MLWITDWVKPELLVDTFGNHVLSICRVFWVQTTNLDGKRVYRPTAVIVSRRHNTKSHPQRKDSARFLSIF